MGSSTRLPKILLLKHDESTTVGTALDWARSRPVIFEVAVAETFFDSPAVEYDGVILFGGDMQAWETKKFPWLEDEKEFIARMINSDRAVFGICLGAQLLAEQLGASVLPMGFWQFGWSGVSLTNGRRLLPFHCHETRFTRPAGAKIIATDKTNFNQGFRLSDQLVGYQFHCEIDSTRMEHILKNAKPEFASNAPSVRADFARFEQPLREWFFAELDRWLEAFKSVSELPSVAAPALALPTSIQNKLT